MKKSYDPAEEIDWDVSDEDRDIDDLRAEAGDKVNFIGLSKIYIVAAN